MSENPLLLLFKTYEKVSNSVQTQLAQFIGLIPNVPSSHSNNNNNNGHHSSFSLLSSSSKNQLATSTVLLQDSELPNKYPDKPTRQQRKDVKELMAILSRMYPCSECADHFKEVLRANPVQAGSQAEFSQWLCHVHNIVNRSLSKPKFPCDRVDARWGKLDCEQRACDLQGTDKFWF
ncbi:FAD-linked sulfhydryl oxidase ERV1 isoform X2 [Capsicum annuum]|uniref:FAD-linked sulfhydryl oxidase ERV1 isoform X2 n=1 Tax=Capsicum annuum TaxID=4072 RepID=UPI0007BF5D47|nr:FAD-linked sulfhydryl oxidase ERV1 isoform X2 [Capsicum annuum]